MWIIQSSWSPESWCRKQTCESSLHDRWAPATYIPVNKNKKLHDANCKYTGNLYWFFKYSKDEGSELKKNVVLKNWSMLTMHIEPFLFPHKSFHHLTSVIEIYGHISLFLNKRNMVSHTCIWIFCFFGTCLGYIILCLNGYVAYFLFVLSDCEQNIFYYVPTSLHVGPV